ncbi:MAG: hypothetical protein WD489_05950 [Rhodovibrionaceae bacterium]
MKHWLPASLVLAAGTLLAAPAVAYCSKPIEPHCAVRAEEMGNSYINAADCRRKVDDHVEKLTRYQDCLREMVEESEAQSALYRSLLERTPEE